MAAIDREAEEQQRWRRWRRRRGEVRAARRISISGRCFTGEIARIAALRKMGCRQKTERGGRSGKSYVTVMSARRHGTIGTGVLPGKESAPEKNKPRKDVNKTSRPISGVSVLTY